MTGAWLTTDEIILLVDKQIALMGKDAFGDNKGYAQLYSSASKEVLRLIINSQNKNHGRAKNQAKADDAILLENTPIGQFLDKFGGKGIYDYFARNPLVQQGKEQDEADKVMRHVSRKFIASLWGKVATAVCGAAKDRVFYNDEIPALAETIPDLIARLLKNDDIETINDVSIAAIRKAYNKNDYDKAFRLICLGELRMALKRARLSGKAEDMQDYLERKELYLVERGITWKGTNKTNRADYSMTPQERQAWKESRLQNFVTARLAKTTASIGTPFASRPASTTAKARKVKGLSI